MDSKVIIEFVGDTSNVDKSVKGLDSSFGKLTKSMTLGNLAAQGITKGLNLMAQNMDGAINRIDTMNNFPKVMKNFGVSTDEANESVKRIDKSVQGLPTSLDQAVAGVQDLFMVTKDLKESEKLFQAINDSAMVFANGSTEAVDRFIYGYKQALSAGKVSAQDFNQMNEAIPGLMSKVAEKMNITYAELKSGLSNGSISIEQFNDALKLLDTEGVGAMESLQKGAKTSTGGIKTSIANMKTAFVRGVSSIIKTIDSSLSSFGGLTGVISSVGKIGEQAFKFIGDALKDVIPMLIDIVKQIMPVLLSGMKKIMPSLQKLASALLPAIQKIVEKLVPALSHILEKLLPMIAPIIDSIIPLIDPLVNFMSALIDYFMAGIEPALNVLSTILPPIIAALSFIAQTLLPLLTGWLNILTNIINGIPNIIKGVINFIISIPGIIGDVVMNIISFVTQLPEYIGFAIGYIAGVIFKFVTQDIPNFIKTALDFIKALPGNLANIFRTILDTVASWLSDMYNKCKTSIKNLVSSIVSWFKDLPGKMVEIGKNIVKGLWNGIKGMKDWVMGKIKDFGLGIIKGFKSSLGIHSPSKEFALIGEFSVLGYTEALDKMSKDVDKQINETFGLNPQMTSSMQNTYNPNIQVYNNVNIEQDPLGQMVSNIKTFSGGAKNDYNYGLGV